jgi:hypothetical protein
MTITLASSAFWTAQELVSPLRRFVPQEAAEDLFVVIKNIEDALTLASEPPPFMCAKDADTYSRWRWKMPFVGKSRPPFKPLGQNNFYKKEDIDAWAIARIEARPVVEHVR